MKLIIDIPDEVYEDIDNYANFPTHFTPILRDIVKKGIPDNTPVIERPKGKWLRDKDGSYCSGCGARAAKDNYLMELRTNFCSCCGLDLRGEN